MGISDSNLPGERQIIRQAPVTWALAVIASTLVLSGASFLIIDSRYSGQVEGLRQQVETLNTQIAGKDGRIAELETKIANDAEMVARALHFYQQSLTQKVQELPESLEGAPASVEIIGGGDNPFVTSLGEAFIEGGWKVNSGALPGFAEILASVNATGASPEWSESGIYLSIPENESGRTVKHAFDEADIPYVLWKDANAGEVPQVLVTSPEVTSALATPREP